MKSLFITVSDNITNVLERVQAFYERLGRTLTYNVTIQSNDKPVVWMRRCIFASTGWGTE